MADTPPEPRFTRVEHDGNILIVMPASDAFIAEAFMAGVTNTQPASVDHLAAFMHKAAPKTLQP